MGEGHGLHHGVARAIHVAALVRFGTRAEDEGAVGPCFLPYSSVGRGAIRDGRQQTANMGRGDRCSNRKHHRPSG